MSKEKDFFQSGDLVVLNKEIDNKPVMMVHKIVQMPIKQENTPSLLGVKCIWFDTSYLLHSFLFNFKDLKKVSGIRS